MGVPEFTYKMIAFAGLVVLRRHRRRGVRLLRRHAATRDVGPDPVRRVHRDPADRRRRHDGRCRCSARSSSCCLRGSSRTSPAGWAARPQGGDSGSKIWDIFISTGPGDFGFVSTADIAPGFPLPVSRLDELIYGALIVMFLLFEPLGLYGIWIKIRNYWKGWPFSY